MAKYKRTRGAPAVALSLPENEGNIRDKVFSDMGFMKLSSTRTLFDFSHYVKGKVGFDDNVIRQLILGLKKYMQHDWEKYVGIL